MPQFSKRNEKLPPSQNNQRLVWLYAGLAFQLLAALGVAVLVGRRADRWMGIKVPLMVWVLPLLVIIAVIIKVIKDTGRKSKGEK